MSRLSDCLGKVSAFLKKSGKDNPLTSTVQERMARDVERLTEKKVAGGMKEPEAHLEAAKEIVGKHLSTTKTHLESAQQGIKDRAAWLNSQEAPIRTETPEENPEPTKATETPQEPSNAPEPKETAKETVSDDRPRSARVPEQYTAKELALPAHMADKGSVHHRQIERAIYENKPVHAGEAKRYGIELPDNYRQGKDDISRPESGEIKASRMSFGSEPIGEPKKQVSNADRIKAVESLRMTPTGRNLLRTAQFVPDWERAISESSKLKREFSAKEINLIKSAQGFYDPQTGKTFVIRDNIQLKPNETPDQAVVRVLMHERVGHDGMAWMRANDKQFERDYFEAAKGIPESELKEIVQRYGNDKLHDRDSTIGEWFAQNIESLKPDELPDPKTPFGRMWQAVKNFISRLLYRSSSVSLSRVNQDILNRQVRELASAILHSTEALEPRLGLGEIEASLPQVVKDIGDKLGKAGKEAKDMLSEGMKVKPFTALRKAINKLGAHFQIGSLENRTFQKEAKKLVPDKLTRRAIGAYIEADGNIAVLDMQEQASTGSAKDKYKRAQKLTPEQIAWGRHLEDLYYQKGQQLVAAGALDPAHFKANYLTKIWKQPLSPAKQKLIAGFRSQLKSTFKFGKKSTWNNFFQGEQAGFEPLTDDPMELYAIYNMEATKTLATRNFIKDLTTLKASDGNPLAVPIGGSVDTGVPPKSGDPALITSRIPVKTNASGDDVDYRRVDNAALKKWKWVDKTPDGNDVLYQGELAIHPEAYTHIKNMLGRSAIKEWYESPSTTMGQSVAKKAVKIADVLNSSVKQSMLSFSPFHIVQEATHAVGHKVSPFSFEKIDPSNPAHQDAMAHGLQLAGDQTSMDQWMEGASGGGWTSHIPVIGKLNKAIGDFTFHDYIPGLKLKTYEAALSRNMERFRDDIASGKHTASDIKALTAEQVNNAYGGLNYREMGANPTIEHMLRLILLAPDFLRARLGFTKQAVQGLVSKTGREQLNAMAVLAGTFYTGARILNALINNGDTKAKEAPFGVMVGDRIYTMRNVPEDIYKAMTEPRKFVSGRLSPLIARTAMEGLSGRDYRGQLISGGDTAINALLQAIPISARELPGLKDLTTTTSQNPISPWEQFMSSLGVHANRHSPISATYQNLNAWEKEQGKPDKGTQPVSRYAQLRYALEDNNPDKAKSEWDKLVQKEHDQSPKVPLSQLKEKIAQGFHSSTMRGFADSTADEKEFYKSLDPDQKAQFKEATHLKGSIWKRFTRATQAGKSLSSEAKDRL